MRQLITSDAARAIAAMIATFTFLVACKKPFDNPPPLPPPSLGDMVETVRSNNGKVLILSDVIVQADDLELVADLSNLEHISIEHFAGSAESLVHLASLPTLRRLQIRGGSIGDSEAKAIASCRKLRNVNLPDASFTDEGLAALANLPELELLRFGSPKVSDAGMSQLAVSSSLRFLHLISVPITDDGLAQLESIEQLESLYLDDTNATDDGVERLLKALPDLHLHIDQQHSDRDPSKGTHPH